ncbi:Anaphase-promoting complex subunit 1 [Sorochytrium milnesiophthora]
MISVLHHGQPHAAVHDTALHRDADTVGRDRPATQQLCVENCGRDRDARLVISGDAVRWHVGQATHQLLTFGGAVVAQALFVSFPAATVKHGSDQFLAVLLPDKIKLYHASGRAYTINLPFVAKRAFALAHGMLIEPLEPATRAQAPGRVQPLYHLQHPLDELLPVARAGGGNIVHVSQSLPQLLVTASEDQLTIYTIAVRDGGDFLLNSTSCRLVCLHVLKGGSLHANLKVFTAHESTGDTVLCVLSGDVLTLWRTGLQIGQAVASTPWQTVCSKLQSWQASAAEPVAATRGGGQLDVFFVDRNQASFVWDGARVIECDMPPSCQRVFEHHTAHIGKRDRIDSADVALVDDAALCTRDEAPLARIVDLRDHVGRHLTAVMSNGHTYRLSIGTSSPAVDYSAALDKLSDPAIMLPEAHKILYPVGVPVIRSDDSALPTGDEELGAYQQSLLQILLCRTSTLPFGRSLLSFGIHRPLQNEALEFPSLTFSGRFEAGAAPVELANDGDCVSFSKFHNGVAAGLRIPPDFVLAESWLWFVKPATIDASFAGFVLGLGLTKHLSGLSKILKARLFAQDEGELMQMAAVLGLAASHVGTADGDIHGILAIFLPSLRHSASLSDAFAGSTSVLFQATCILSFGLLSLGKPRPRQEEYLVNEIERDYFANAEGSDAHRAAYSLSAGFACGLVFLGVGKHLSQVRQAALLRRLARLVQQQQHTFRSSTATAASDNSHRPQHLHALGTAYGAMAALSLTWLKTNDAAASACLRLPANLDDVLALAPDILMLRVVSYYLVMWDDIGNTVSWVQGVVPACLSHNYTSKPALRHEILTAERRISSGACFAMALRYAGTSNKDAKRTLLHYIELLVPVYNRTASGFSAKIAHRNAGQCLDSLVVSLGLVMTGSGDLETLRLLKAMHSRLDASITFGSHLATHTALGLLFLAGGKYALSHSNTAIAAMLCAFFPLFPTDHCDSGVHVMLYRHLWTLAVVPRSTPALTQSSHQLAPLRVSLQYHAGQRLHSQRNNSLALLVSEVLAGSVPDSALQASL